MPKISFTNEPPFGAHFVLSKGSHVEREHWSVQSLNGWTLSAGPNLPIAPCLANGQHAGWVLGDAVDGRSKLVSNENPLEVGSDPESVVWHLAGRWLLILVAAGMERVYTDAFAKLPAVFAEDGSIVASTPNLIASDERIVWDRLNSLGFPHSSGAAIPSDMTPYEGVRRCLPNHYLDLAAMRPVRWTNYGDGEEYDPFDGAIAAFATELRRVTCAFVDAFPSSYVTVTAGGDSRMMFASLLPRIGRFVPMTFPTQKKELWGARKVVRHAGVRLHVPEPAETTKATWDRWLLNTGNCVDGEILKFAGMLDNVDETRMLINGVGGEVVRNYYHRYLKDYESPLNSEEIVRVVHLPRSDWLVEAYGSWFDTVSHLPLAKILDLLYIEQRLGCWSGPASMTGRRFPGVSAFCCHRLQELGMRIPVDRRRVDATISVVRYFSPELARIPVNPEPTWRLVARRVRSALRGPAG